MPPTFCFCCFKTTKRTNNVIFLQKLGILILTRHINNVNIHRKANILKNTQSLVMEIFKTTRS